MKTFNLKDGMPTSDVAILRLKNALRYAKSEKVVKIIHGYGSHGVGGTIRTVVREELAEMLASRQIKAYIPGEAVSVPMGFDEQIRRYRNMIENDSDFRKGNDGITYVFFI